MVEKTIEASVGAFQDPYVGKSWLEMKAIKKLEISADLIRIDIVLPYPCDDIKSELATSLRESIHAITQGREVLIAITSQIDAHAGKQGMPSLPNVKNIIAVASGKGGVGKSTVAVNMALALARAGARVGLVDADIYGPSQPTMLGAEGMKPEIEDKTFLPIIRHGIQSMSIGYLVQETSALVWRGPMIGKAMQQLINDTKWDHLDYLIVDLPPGTGDIQLTLCQKIPVTGAVIVTTPQDLALADVRRACEMFNKLNVSILGVIENMSTYHCPQCGHEAAIFGEGGGKKLQQEYNINLLGQVPLNLDIRQLTDSGKPPVTQLESLPAAKIFMDAARKAAANLYLLPKDYSAKFPKVVVETKKS